MVQSTFHEAFCGHTLSKMLNWQTNKMWYCAGKPTENGHAASGPSPSKPAKGGKAAVDVSLIPLNLECARAIVLMVLLLGC